MFDISVILITNDGWCAVLQQGLNGRVVRAGFFAFDEAPTNVMSQSKNAWSKRGLGSHMFMVLKPSFYRWVNQREVFGKPLHAQAVIRAKLAAMISRAESVC